MSKKLFTDKKVTTLSKNINISKVSNKAITYTFKFKKKFIEEYQAGKLPRIIFEESNFDVKVLGSKRISTASKRWRAAFKKDGELGLKDSRKTSSGRPLKRALTDSEKIQRLEGVKKEVRRFINYYNNERYQWNLKKMTPIEYRNHLLLVS